MFNVKVLQFGYQGNEAYYFRNTNVCGNNDRGFSVRTIANNQDFRSAAGGNSNIVYGYSSEKDINKWYHVTIVIDQNIDLMHLYGDPWTESNILKFP